MNSAVSQPNLVFAWVWMLAGFVSGMMMGLRFHDENWMGGYGSFKRRMYRLGHISFFGLGAVNLFFHLSVKDAAPGAFAAYASLAFIIGGISMPVCCWLMARSKKFQGAFAVPVLSLIAGAILTILEVTL